LSEPKVPNPREFPEEDREFNRYTLLGEYDALFIALLRQRLYQDGFERPDLGAYFRSHMNRGIVLLQQRVRSVADLASLVGSSPEGTKS
jgi:DNA sulfur modification protein DndE